MSHFYAGAQSLGEHDPCVHGTHRWHQTYHKALSDCRAKEVLSLEVVKTQLVVEESTGACSSVQVTLFPTQPEVTVSAHAVVLMP